MNADGDASSGSPIPRFGPPLAAYIVAHGGKTLFWTASDLYFAFYLNEVCGIAPAVTGLTVGASILVAAMADLGTGRWLGPRIRTAQAAGRLQFTGGVGASITLGLFAATAFIAVDWRVFACVASLLLFRLAYALIDVPQNALLSLLPRGNRDRATLVAGRNVAAGMSRIVLSTTFVPIMRAGHAIDAAPRFLWLVAAIATVALVGSALLAVCIDNRVLAPVEQSVSRPGHESGYLIRMFVASATLTGFIQLEPYIATQAIRSDNAATIFLTAIAAGGILFQPLWRRRVLGNPGRLWTNVFWSTVAAAACLVLTPLDGALGSVFAGAMCGLATGGILFAVWADFAAHTNGSDVLFAYAKFTAVAKLAQGFSVVAIGFWLQRSATAGPMTWSVDLIWAAAVILITGSVILTLVRPGDRDHDRTQYQSS